MTVQLWHNEAQPKVCMQHIAKDGNISDLTAEQLETYEAHSHDTCIGQYAVIFGGAWFSSLEPCGRRLESGLTDFPECSMAGCTSGDHN